MVDFPSKRILLAEYLLATVHQHLVSYRIQHLLWLGWTKSKTDFLKQFCGIWMVGVIANNSKEFPVKRFLFLFSSHTDHHGSQSEINLKDKLSTAVCQCSGGGNISIYVESIQVEVTIPCQPCVAGIHFSSWWYMYVCIRASQISWVLFAHKMM